MDMDDMYLHCCPCKFSNGAVVFFCAHRETVSQLLFNTIKSKLLEVTGKLKNAKHFLVPVRSAKNSIFEDMCHY